VRVQPPGGPVLTTQLYFPDEPANTSDGIFSADLVMDISDQADSKEGFFRFVLST
jgi:protocatechuate 3,4-dioxygenase beta subunit